MMTGFRLNLSPLKEPLGFVKLVEWLTAIFAFGGCCGFSGTNIISLFCGDGSNETDFVITAILVFLWLVSSSAWAKGLQNLKDATNTEGIGATLAVCKGSNITCEVTDFASMRTLNISVVFGYLNMFIWAGNSWFVYKETRWHAQKFSSQAGPGRQHVPAPI